MMRKKTIIGKLVQRIILIYALVSLLSIVLLAALMPSLYRQKEKEIDSTLQSIREEYLRMTQEAATTIQGICLLPEFKESLRLYREEADTIKDEEKDRLLPQAEARLQLLLSAYRLTNDNICLILVEDERGHCVHSTFFLYDVYYQTYLEDNPRYRQLSSGYAQYISPVFYPETDFSEILDNSAYSSVFAASCFCCSRFVNIDSYSYKITGFYRADGFIRVAEALKEKTVDEVSIIDRDSSVCYVSTAESNEAVSGLVSNSTEQGSDSTDRGSNLAETDAEWVIPNTGQLIHTGDHYDYAKPLTEMGGIIAGRIRAGRFYSSLFYYILLFLLLLLVPSLFLLLMLIPVSRKSLSSISTLTGEMETFQIGGELPKLIESGDETEILSRAFRDLGENVNRQAQILVRQEVDAGINTYRLLTTQLDVHFVSNTMNIINIMARNGQTEGIQNMNNALIRILRNRLNTSRNIFGTVAEEIELIRQYMMIIEYRYATRVSISYDISPEARDRLILKNVLQLLVENSLFHGLLQEDGSLSGSISIVCYLDEDHVVIEESDDGVGIPKERLQMLRTNRFLVREPGHDEHIGLRNIYERLELVYQDFSMEIFSMEREGTTVVITMAKAKLER